MRFVAFLAAFLLSWQVPSVRAQSASTARESPAAAALEQAETLTLLEGSFAVVGSAPDGDTVRFYPRDPDHWRLLGRIRANKRGGASLRLQGVDALETHYAPKRSRIGGTRQPVALAQAASAELLRWLGFTAVQRRGEKITATEPASVPGYILTSGADAYGRAIAFAYRGEHPGESGARVRFDGATYAASLNRHLLAEGYAYPLLYTSLGSQVRNAMAKDAAQARKRRAGVWAKDRTTAGFAVPASLAETQARAFVMPKLFRRLMDYVATQDGSTALAGFPQFLAARDERVIVASEGKTVSFASLVKVDGQSLRLRVPVEELVFQDE